MIFRIYGNNYFTGWELIKCVQRQEDIINIIDNMDARVFDSYLVIRRYNNMDEVIDKGTLDRPLELNKHRR